LHSTEAAASQMSMELAYDLSTGDSDEIREILDRVIILLIPCANPDGQQMVSDYYHRTLGTPWEGGRMPWIYQKYAGHDNNRDWFMLNLQETRLSTQVLYKEWFPTFIWDVHQARKNSMRMFVPPFYDPRNPNTHPLIDKMEVVSLEEMEFGFKLYAVKRLEALILVNFYGDFAIIKNVAAIHAMAGV